MQCVEVGLEELGGRVCVAMCACDCYVVCVGSNVYLGCVGFGYIVHVKVKECG